MLFARYPPDSLPRECASVDTLYMMITDKTISPWAQRGYCAPPPPQDPRDETISLWAQRGYRAPPPPPQDPPDETISPWAQRGYRAPPPPGSS